MRQMDVHCRGGGWHQQRKTSELTMKLLLRHTTVITSRSARSSPDTQGGPKVGTQRLQFECKCAEMFQLWIRLICERKSHNHRQRECRCTLSSGRASAVKEPGHFEVRKSSSQVTRMNFFPQKKLTTFFSCRSDIVTFLFSVHTITTEAKQYPGLGRAEPGLEPGRWIFQPGHLTWRTLV